MIDPEITLRLDRFEEEGYNLLLQYQQKLEQAKGSPVGKVVTKYAIGKYVPRGCKSDAKNILNDVKKANVEKVLLEASNSVKNWLNSLTNYLGALSIDTPSITEKGNSGNLVRKLNHAKRAVKYDTKIKRGLTVIDELRTMDLIQNRNIKKYLREQQMISKEYAQLKKEARSILKNYPEEKRALLGAIERLEAGGIDAWRQCLSSCRICIENLVKMVAGENVWKIGLPKIVRSKTKRDVIKKTFQFLSAYGSHGSKDPGKEIAKSGVEQTFGAIRLIISGEKPITVRNSGGRVRNEESQSIEWKRSQDLKNIVKTVAAFATTNGGTILVGVEDQGTVRGVEIGKKTIEQLSNEIVQNTQPKIYPLIEVIQMEGKNVIQIKIEESQRKPVLAYSVGYKRVGKSNHKLSRDELLTMVREEDSYHWDEQISPVLEKDIDDEKLRIFLKKISYERRINIDIDLPSTDALDKLHAIKNGHLTNAGALMFSVNPQKSYPQSEIKCARFKGNEPLIFIDVKELQGSIAEQIPKAIIFIQEHIKLSAEIKGIQRVEEWEYPIEALREAIINAVCHRDYEEQGNVQIRIFDDRIEIWSPGLLPKGITLELLEKSHPSKPRNRHIADLFFLMNYIEKWGTGTNRMISECMNHGLPKPTFEEVANCVVVIFMKGLITDEILESLNDRQRVAIKYIEKHGKITNEEYQEINNIGRTTTKMELSDLTQKTIIRLIGKGRTAYYQLNRNGH